MTTLADKIKQIDGDRFVKIIDAMNVKDICAQCDYFNLSIRNPKMQYRCYVACSCIAATLSEVLIIYINKKLGWI
jgi:hypothetical protein